MTCQGPLMPVFGWSWACPCGWATTRDPSLEQTEQRRNDHVRLHTAEITLPTRGDTE